MSGNTVNCFSNFNASIAHQFSNQFGTPLFIMEEEGVLQRFHALHEAVKKRYSHSQIAISYKTCFLKGLLALLHHVGAHAEVVSGIEYAVAKQIIGKDQKIVFNGPMKTQDELTQAMIDGAMINCDHDDEIDHIEQIAKNLSLPAPIGLRVYFPDKQSTWNRFGFCVEETLNVDTIALLKRIHASPHLKLAGLHAHIGTNIRHLDNFNQLGRSLNQFAVMLKQNFNIELDWIDVGGGLAGIAPYIHENRLAPHPLPDVNQYAEAIINPLLPYLHSLHKPARLVFEPGRTLFEAYGALLTRVVGHRKPDTEGIPGLICDAGINTLATSYVYDFPIRTFSSAGSQQITRLLGPTCNQQDQLHTPLLLPQLNVNDLLLFYGTGSYCMAFSYSFIRFRPGVILWRGDHEGVWLRKPETLAHHAALEHLPQARKETSNAE